MSDTEATVVLVGAFAAFVAPAAISQELRQRDLAKRKGRIYAATPGAVLPSKRAVLIGLAVAAVWVVVSSTVVLLT